MNVIIFTNDIRGHHLEYIHHVYDAVCDDHDNRYYFVVPKGFSEIKDNYSWQESNNVIFDLYDNSSLSNDTKGIAAKIRYSIKITKFINKYIRKYAASQVFVNTLVDFLIAAPFILVKGAYISGIIYKIFTRDPQITFARKLFEVLIYYIAVKSNSFKNIFILNDNESPIRLNSLTRTQKFISIVDPYVPIILDEKYDFRKDYNVSQDLKLFVLLGALNKNKGTLEVVDSILLLDNSELSKYFFVFAGKVSEDIKDDFYNKINLCSRPDNIIVIDKFCSYSFLASICSSCDAILLPYKRVAQSSGMIGYAAQFNKPVIAPKTGLLGYLVESYHLGLLIDQIAPDSLREAYHIISNQSHTVDGSPYCNKNNIKTFNNTILLHLKK